METPPRSNKNTLRTRITLFMGMLLLSGCTPDDGIVTVVNGSTSTLTGLVASGVGYSVPFGPIAPGAQLQVTISPLPAGSAGLKLEFDADGKHFSSTRAASVWNGMKEVILTVDPKFSVSAETVTTF